MALSDEIHLGHVNIEVTDLANARRFYDKFLPVLGFARVPPVDPIWLGYREARIARWITVSHPKRVTRSTPQVPTDGIEDPISDHLGSRAAPSKRVADIEATLQRRGFKPVYSTTKQTAHGPTWYTSNAWSDPDHNVFEIYALTKR